MGLYERRKSLWQRRQEGLPTTSIGPTDPEDAVEKVALTDEPAVVVEEKQVKPVLDPPKIDKGFGKIKKDKFVR